MPKARLYFDGDNTWIEKEAREYSLTQAVEDKLDSIDTIETTLQGEIDDLQDQIDNLASRGRYLSTWDCVSWLPDTNPQTDPYVYRAWDYYIVSTVGWTNYRPNGSEYHIWVASQVVESLPVSQNDLYIYDWIQWILQQSWSSLNAVWWSITWTLSAQTDLQNALNTKANAVDLNTKAFPLSWDSWQTALDEAQAIYNWYAAGKTPIIKYSDKCYYFVNSVSSDLIFRSEINSFFSKSSYSSIAQGKILIRFLNGVVTEIIINSADNPRISTEWFLLTNHTYSNPYIPTDPWHPATKKYVDDNSAYVWSSAPSNPTEWKLWYDTTNDVLKSYDGTNWNKCWWWSDIEYKTQAEYNALLPWAESDDKHYFIYTPSTPWQPWVNTILYAPLKLDLLDHWPNSITINNTGVSLVSSQASIDVWYFDGNSFLSGWALSNFWDFHVSVWVKLSSITWNQFIFAWGDSGDIFLGYQTVWWDKIWIGRNGVARDNSTSYTLSADTWYLLSFDRQWSTLTFSVNSNVIWMHSNSYSYSTAWWFEIGNDGWWNTITWYMSDVIVESAWWTIQETSDYYNATKWDYWIS